MRLLIALLTSLLVTSPGATQEKPRWIGVVHEDGAVLMYGLPNTGDVRLHFSCARKGQPLSFTFDHEPRNAKNGMKVSVSLSANGVDVTIPTAGERMEMDGAFILSGQTRLDDRLKRLLTSGGVMKVRAGRRSADFPLDGAAEAAKALLSRCG